VVLNEVVACPGGGEAYAFTHVCAAGNPEVQVELRPGIAPFMCPIPVSSAREASQQLGKCCTRGPAGA